MMYGTEGRADIPELGSGSHNVSDLSQGCTHIRRQHRSYGFQLVVCHCGICMSINQEKDGGQLNNKHASPLKKNHNKTWLGVGFDLSSSKARRTTGVGGVKHERGGGQRCFIAPQYRDETLNAADGCIHHGLTPLSGGDKMLNQTSWLSPFVMQDLKYDGFAFLCFKCAHALLKRTMGGFFFLLLLATSHITAILCCYYGDAESFIF